MTRAARVRACAQRGRAIRGVDRLSNTVASALRCARNVWIGPYMLGGHGPRTRARAGRSRSVA
jgi:hypothetical protein